MDTDEFTLPKEVIDCLQNARRVVVLTGAGISAESGVPTFRDAQTGLWAKYDPQELATPQAFRNNPKLVWEWYAWRRDLIRSVSPNPGHLALARFEKKVPVFTVITQNVDGLHQIAGSQNVYELHGNILRFRCSKEGNTITEWIETDDVPPRCPNCGGFIRPDVVWFGEDLPSMTFSNAIRASQNCDLFLTVGTSGIVHPAASLPLAALDKGAMTVEINPNPTPLSTWMTHNLRGPAGIVLPALYNATWPTDNQAAC
ncbi:MAG: NAD-dependent deacylase [Anaerolineae bacterium]|nr:NAD-dependent deacylase [Anaerolineae bacterium]RIK24262.1 MAG: NAD-dependent protein deacylase [Anaerolineae bacterium]